MADEKSPPASPIVAALFQVQNGTTTLWDSLVSVLVESGHVDHAALACKISQLANNAKLTGSGGPIYDGITQSAMRALVLHEYPSLEDAPEAVQKMVRGEVVMCRGVHPEAEGMLVNGKPVSLKGSEGPRS